MLRERIPSQENFHLKTAPFLLYIGLNGVDITVLNKSSEAIETWHASLSKIVQERQVIHVLLWTFIVKEANVTEIKVADYIQSKIVIFVRKLEIVERI